MPRFFGINEIGAPAQDKLWAQQFSFNPNLVFSGNLRPDQINVAQVSLKSLRERGGGVIAIECGGGKTVCSLSIASLLNDKHRTELTEAKPEKGKCFAKNTKILMFDGTIKLVEDIVVGDLLMGDNSTPRRVLSLVRGREMMYDIVPTKGKTYTVNESHILSLKCSTKGSLGAKGDIVDIPLKDYLNLPPTYHGPSGKLLGYRVGVEWPEQEVPMDPYLLGAWLGDGGTKCNIFTTDDDELANYLIDWVKMNYPDGKVYVVRGNPTPTTRHECHYSLRSPVREDSHFIYLLQEVGIWDNKHIPDRYKFNSRDIRMKVLAGLIDTDGSLHHNGYDIIQKRKQLAKDITFLARSLGFSAYMKECQKTCTNAPGGPKTGTYYRVQINGNGLHELPLLLARKRAQPRAQIKDPLVTRIKVIKKDIDDYYGFVIDGNHRFLLADFTVTHNSNEIPQFCVGVVCHTTSMMKQWHERIKQYVPKARIGIVQRDQFQVENKDIIIMSVKTVANRQFAKNAFEKIGLIIWDEIHLMCTKTFSLAFPKLATKYSLGLSATPYRKDQCEKIFQNYIGPVVFMRKRGKDESIEARCITYLMENIEPVYNRFNKIQYTPMTVATINRPERTEWLARYIAELGAAGRNVLVLGEYVSHLKELLRQITALRPVKPVASSIINAFLLSCRSVFPPEIAQKIAHYMVCDVTAGLYIGEMKNEQRKVSENKDIILGTYKLASVGMDIPALNTLVMASPRKEIEQSVGRILRKTHGDDDDIKPLIIDIIDNHTLYQAQSRDRKKFYRSYGYSIVYQQINQDGTVKSTRLMKGAGDKEKKLPKAQKATKKKHAESHPPSAPSESEEEEEDVEEQRECMFE
jgi:superfamily II DNA or RNA helicase